MRIAVFIAAFLALSHVPAQAILPAPSEPTQEAAPPPAQTIDAETDAGEDQRIAERIAGIFSALDNLDTVTVAVQDGVVTLSGVVPTEEEISKAGQLASQIDGVVTVQNRLERDVSIGKNLGALQSLSGKAADFIALLPLLGVAVLAALVIAAAGYLIAGFGAFWRRVMPNVFLAELVASAIRFVFVIGGVVIALDMIGATALLGAVLGGAGVIGIGLGFAMRETIENYVASLMLSLRQPFRANDHVVIDDLEGRIIRLTSRATIMMTLDGNHLRIPNATVFKAVILNYTTNPQRRFSFELGIDADDDPSQARGLGRAVFAGLPFVLSAPAPEARIVNVGDSNIVIQFLAWINQQDTDLNKARSQALAAMKTALEDAGFGLPEPIYRVRLDERTGPLPLQRLAQPTNTADTPAATAGSRSRPVRPAVADEEDVTPENDIAKMVLTERQSTVADDDLLDQRRPTE
ncbi:mechanosensitive ion channel domain-containing protein [Pontixanthobacter sp.]|uniref:mechanosensitive ion channel domain-containing protein n=1 Tax=Pontixanthobacter sp. TaxID=2792078 RepID=UPI003C7CB7C4